MSEKPKYQLLPPLSSAEYDALREDIAVAGVLVPIDVDEHGEILDGHHRKRACDELGVECPTRVVEMPEFAKADYALTVNLARRHLDQAQRRQLVWNSVKDAPKLSDRQHARRCGVSPSTVAKIRDDLIATDAQVSNLDTSRTGRDGKQYPATQPESSQPAATDESVDDVSSADTPSRPAEAPTGQPSRSDASEGNPPVAPFGQSGQERSTSPSGRAPAPLAEPGPAGGPGQPEEGAAGAPSSGAKTDKSDEDSHAYYRKQVRSFLALVAVNLDDFRSVNTATAADQKLVEEIERVCDLFAAWTGQVSAAFGERAKRS